MSRRERPARYPRNGAGDAALTAGMVAVLCAIVPIVGDYLTLPVAALFILFIAQAASRAFG